MRIIVTASVPPEGGQPTPAGGQTNGQSEATHSIEEWTFWLGKRGRHLVQIIEFVTYKGWNLYWYCPHVITVIASVPALHSWPATLTVFSNSHCWDSSQILCSRIIEHITEHPQFSWELVHSWGWGRIILDNMILGTGGLWLPLNTCICFKISSFACV